MEASPYTWIALATTASILGLTAGFFFIRIKGKLGKTARVIFFFLSVPAFLGGPLAGTSPVWLAPWALPYDSPEFSRDSVEDVFEQVVSAQYGAVQGPLASVPVVLISKVFVKHCPVIKVNHSCTISLEAYRTFDGGNVKGYPFEPGVYSARLDFPKTGFEMYGSMFGNRENGLSSVPQKPEDQETISIATDSFMENPFFQWRLTSKQTGRYRLVISQLSMPVGYAGLVAVTVQNEKIGKDLINDRSGNINGSIDLEISVVTPIGISQENFDVLTMSMMIVGSILSGGFLTLIATKRFPRASA